MKASEGTLRANNIKNYLDRSNYMPCSHYPSDYLHHYSIRTNS
jgi:hypothetical protein